MALETFGQGRSAFRFGQQAINLDVKGHEFEPKARLPAPGALYAAIGRFQAKGISVIEGPVRRTGAPGPIRFIYLRDPGLTLIENPGLSNKAAQRPKPRL